MNKGCLQALRKSVAFVICMALPLVALSSTTLAKSAVSSATAEAVIGVSPDGIPDNPASVAAVPSTRLQVGAGLPFGENTVGYVAFYEPKDPRGLGAAFSGMLGAYQEKAVVGVDVITQEPVYYTSTAAVYQVAEALPRLGAFGAGVRYMRDTDGQSSAEGSAWRIDLGWQGTVASLLTIGVSARDLLGTDLRFSDNSVVAREPSVRVGAALKLGTAGVVSADYQLRETVTQLSTEHRSRWSAGLSVNVLPALTLRGGYRCDDDGTETATVGAGLHVGKWQVDAAGTLGQTPTGMVGVTMEF